MIQINPQVTGDRAASLLMIRKLRDEAARIVVEIERLTRAMESTSDTDRPSLFDRQ
jgi:hypothetical protein